MAIKRITFEIDDQIDNHPVTGSTVKNIPVERESQKDQTRALGDYTESEASKNDEIATVKPTTGRTWPDLILELKNDAKFTSILMIIISFLFFIIWKSDSFNFLEPLILSAILIFVYHLYSIFEKKS